MKRILIAALLLVVLAGCAGIPFGASTRGSGRLVSRSYDLDGFSVIDANNAAQVEVALGDEFRVDVEVDDNLVDLLNVSVSGKALLIRLKQGPYTKVTLRAKITMPELAGIKLNGASTLHSEAAGQDLDLDLNGASVVNLTGTAGRVTLKANGASQALLAGMEAGDVQLDVNGASHVEVQSRGAVGGRVNGASTATVSGSPTTVDVKAEGASRVVTK